MFGRQTYQKYEHLGTNSCIVSNVICIMLLYYVVYRCIHFNQQSYNFHLPPLMPILPYSFPSLPNAKHRAVLSFCLSTHPKDPNLANKIVVHLQQGPLVSREFDLYCEAMSPGFVVSASEDLIRYWKMFTMNYIRMLQNHGNSMCEQLSVSQNEVVKRCVTFWCEM